jgi:hypothetical protein
MVNQDKIHQSLRNHFFIPGDYQIDPVTGIVNVQGDVQLRMDSLVTKLPVSFGTVTGNFWCIRAKLLTLKGAPRTVGRDFWCYENDLKSLAGAPDHVGGELDVRFCSLKNFVGAPAHVGGDFFARRNPVESLDGLPDHIPGELDFDYAPNLHMLRSLVAHKVDVPNDYDDPRVNQLNQILNRHAGKGRSGAIACAAELIRAGFRENARW